VLGGGNGSFAAAGDMALAGHEVRLWRRDRAAVETHRAAGGTILVKDFRGRHEAKLSLVTNDIAVAADGAELILCPAPATAQGDIARKGDDRDAPARHRGLHRDLERARHLLRIRDHLAVVATLREEVLRVGLLEVSAADLMGGDLRGNGEHGHTAPVAIVQPVDQVQVARAAAAGADGELAGEVRFCSRGEGCRLLVPHGDPSKPVLSPDGIGDSVERVSRDPIDPRHFSADEGVHQQFCDRLLSHDVPSCLRAAAAGSPLSVPGAWR